MKWIICKEGADGPGCDYSIGCNQIFEEIESDATTIEELVDELDSEILADRDDFYMSGIGNKEMTYSSVLVVQAEFIDISEHLRNKISNRKIKADQEIQIRSEDAEKALYNKLHKKYG